MKRVTERDPRVYFAAERTLLATASFHSGQVTARHENEVVGSEQSDQAEEVQNLLHPV